MKHVMFWAMQVVVLLSVCLYTWHFFDSYDAYQPQVMAAQTVAPPQVEATEADSVVFYQPTGSTNPDPYKIHNLVNESRQAAGLAPLLPDPDLANIAQERAVEMNQLQYYAHEHPETKQTFVDNLDAHDYEYQLACENLNLALTGRESSTLQAWLRSSNGHAECLLQPNTQYAGYAVTSYQVHGREVAYVVVAIYAAR